MKLNTFFDQIEQLGIEIQNQARKHSAFSEVATTALNAISFDIDSAELFYQQLKNSHNQLPDQLYTGSYGPGFYCPTLYINDLFMINIHFSYKNATFLHSHNFDGAFKVLSGQFSETLTKRANGKTLSFKYRTLEINQVTSIKNHPDLFHQVIKDSPVNISLIVRTKAPDISEIIVGKNHFIKYSSEKSFKQSYSQFFQIVETHPFDINQARKILETCDKSQKELLFYSFCHLDFILQLFSDFDQTPLKDLNTKFVQYTYFMRFVRGEVGLQ